MRVLISLDRLFWLWLALAVPFKLFHSESVSQKAQKSSDVISTQLQIWIKTC